MPLSPLRRPHAQVSRRFFPLRPHARAMDRDRPEADPHSNDGEYVAGAIRMTISELPTASGASSASGRTR